MSNPQAWRAKPRTATPNARQKRNGLFIDKRPICEGCRASRSKHAHHMLDKGFACRTSWYAMRAYCEPCHVQWHRPATIVFVTTSGNWRIKLDPQERLTYPAASLTEARAWQSMSMRRVQGYVLTRQHVRMVFSPRWGV